MSWISDAACRGVDPDIFFPISPTRTTADGVVRLDAEAKAVCAGCPVRARCLQQAAAYGEEYGVWGGLGEDERRARRGGSPEGRAQIECKCCGTFGVKAAKGYIRACYARWDNAGRPEDGPPPPWVGPRENGTWKPSGPRGERMLARYAELAAGGWSEEQIAEKLGVGKRQFARYATYWRSLQEVAA